MKLAAQNKGKAWRSYLELREENLTENFLDDVLDDVETTREEYSRLFDLNANVDEGKFFWEYD